MATNIVYDNENNHTLSNAQTVTIDDIVYGKIATISEIDFYRVVFSGTGLVTFKLNIPANAKYYMRILDENVNVLDEAGGDIGDPRTIERTVQANTTYIVRINASNSTNIVPNAYYNLQFIPKQVTSVSLSITGLEGGEIAKNNTATLSCTYEPEDAYADFTYATTKNKVSITGNTLRAVANGDDIITVSNYGSTIIDSEDLTVYTSITLNQNRCNNWNQYYTDIVNRINSTSGCSWTVGLDVANIYGPSSYEPSDMPASAWDPDDGYYWCLPSGCTGTIQAYGESNLEDSELLNQICNEIDNNRPVVIELYKYGLSNPQHFVVAYKYYNSGTAKSDIYVFDPGVGSGSSSQMNGLNHTLPDAEKHNYNKTMRRLRKTIGR